MKTFVKILSMLVAVIMIVSVGVVGMTAYAAPTDYFGEVDFQVVDNPYEDIEWDNGTLHAFKSSTHAHTVRSDGDIELNDSIWEHYMKGYEVIAYTDHGTVNGVDIKENGQVTGVTGVNGRINGWTEDQDRCALYAYQSFVHGNIDEITQEDYMDIIYGVIRDGRNPDLVGKGMFNLPLGNEANAMSGNKCHVNTYHISFGHGANRSVEWPESTVAGSYNDGGFSRINHVGEWTDGNGNPSVYNADWIQKYVTIFERYCPNRAYTDTQKSVWEQNDLVTGQPVVKGVIGMELVNTSDSRTHNDRRHVYDESLKLLAPQGINMWGFCEDDSHEESDVDKNAQYFLVNDGTPESTYDVAYYDAKYGKGASYGYTGDIRYSMTNGEFYASSKNSKNSYELGDGFNPIGDYPSINYFHIDEERDQIILRVNNSSKVRIVADGNILNTKTIDETEDFTEVIFDLNEYERNINSYVRIYMTGRGGISYLQPILLKKADNKTSHVQFVLPSSDTKLSVADANGKVITTEYNDNIFVLPAGNYTYTASRNGYKTKTESFAVTPDQIAAGEKITITVELEQDENVSFAFFYAPETIYLDPTNGRNFQYYVDRENRDDGPLIVDPAKTTGNVYFHREGATNVKISYSFYEGDANIQSLALGQSETTGNLIATQITSGVLDSALSNGQYVLIVWDAAYDYGGTRCHSYTYSYIYRSPSGTSATLSAGGKASTEKNVWGGWSHSDMFVVASVFAYGVHKIETTNANGYEYAPYSGNALTPDKDPYVPGSAYKWVSDRSGGGSVTVTAEGDTGYIYADTSRINGFEDIPYFTIGFDINNSEEATGKDGSPASLLLTFGSKTYINETNIPRLDDDAYHGKRIYQLDNTVANNKVNYEFDSSEKYVLYGEASGSKNDRTDRVKASVTIVVEETNKQALREQLENSIKKSLQSDWFENPDEYTNYRDTIAQAAKILGNPAATPEEVKNGATNLDNVENNTHLKSGHATVHHYLKYSLGDETIIKLIKSENRYSYTFNESLVVNAIQIDGYRYANEYERYVNGGTTPAHTGTANYEVVTAAYDSYEWKFYYNPETYAITYNTGTTNFVPNSGSGSYASYGQDYTIASNAPSRTGYDFDGWYLDVDPNPDNKYRPNQTFPYNYMEPGQFNAKWVPLEYGVSFELNGGAFKDGEKPTAEELTTTFDNTYKLPVGVPEKTGYNFTGWKLNDEIYTAGSQLTWVIPGNGEFVAQWSNAVYKVTFDPVASDATVDVESKDVVYDEYYGTLPTPVRTGYTHTWYADKNYPDAALTTATTTVKIAADHTLYAKWTPVVYNISYVLDGGQVVGVNPTTYTIESEALTIKNPEKTGYEFLGWSGTGLDATSYHKDVVIPAGEHGDRTYTAHWKAYDYKISYNLNDDDSEFKAVNNPDNPETFTYADEIVIKPATRTGYTFRGWTGEGYTNVLTITIPAGSYTDNLAFTASWELVNYSINYNLAGGRINSADGSNPTMYNITTDDFTLVNPVRDGYRFFGWQSNYFSDTRNTVTVERGSSGDKQFTAIWASNDNFVTYDLAGGSVDATNPTEYKTGESYILVNPTKQGYTFAGWLKTIINENGTQGATTGPTETGTIVPADKTDLKFTATWTADNYDINYSLNGGRFESYSSDPTSPDYPNPVTYTPETPTFSLINPIRAGYKFAGWSGTELGGSVMNVTVPRGSIGDRSYTANWAVVTYNITYDFNGGAAAGSIINQYNVTTDATIGAPVRAGYDFIGWSQEFHNMTWKSGYLNLETGLLESNPAYPNSVVSSPILLRGAADHSLVYSFSSAMGLENLEIRAFGGGEKGIYAGGQPATAEFAPSGDCYIYIIAKDGHNDTAIQDTIKITVNGLQEVVTIKPGSTGNFKLTANWSLVTYNIGYDLDGGFYYSYDDEGNIKVDANGDYIPGENPNPTEYTTVTDDIILQNPVKPGYNFIGWYDGRTTSTLAIINKGSTGNLNYTAQWLETTYSINYALDGGVVEGNPSSYTYNTETFTLNNPTKTGYIFEGWTGTDITGTSKEVTVEKGSIGDRTYTATWSPITYTITYNMNGGSNPDSNPITYTINDTFTLAQPTKLGATFAGWTGDSINGTSKNVVISAGSTGNLVFNATWDVSSFAITYNLAGGAYYKDGAVINNPNPSSYSVDSDPITLINPTKAGYTFLGWTGANLSAVTEYVTIPSGSTGTRNYIANWQVINYNINYTLGDGAQVGIANPTSYNIETPTFTLNNPVRAGYVFLGWTGTGLEKATLSVTINKGTYGNRGYTATWSVDEFTISCNLNNGELEVQNPSTYTINSNPITLNNPTRVGYKFKGWSGTGITGTGIAETVVIPTGSTGDRVYTANWELETYTITYILGDGASPTVANPETYNYLSSPITLYPPQYPGYAFLGWESDYYEGREISVTIPTNSTGDKVFTAVWEKGVYSITYDLDGGTATNPDEYTYETETFQLNNPTKAGYNFAGWSGTGISGTKMEVYIDKGSTGDRHYVAHWAESTANMISYNLNGGEIVGDENPTSYITNSSIIILTNPVRRGYRFDGWTGTNVPDKEKEVVIDTSTGGNLSFEAHWTAVNYTISYTLGGGTVATANKTKYTVEDQFTLNNPTRTGYEFKGWTGTDLDGTQLAVTIVKGSIGNRTYTAVWEEKIYNLSYDLGAGSVSPANPITYTFSTPTFTLNNPTLTGYTFTGWTEGADDTTKEMVVSITKGSTGDRSFIANYELNTYTITYLGLSGATFTGEKTQYNVTETFAIPNPSKNGYIFNGWSGTGILGVQKDVVVPVGSSGNRTYTAIWSPIVYTINYDLAGGRVSGINPESYTVETNGISVLNPGRAGFTFGGWKLSIVDFSWLNGTIDANGNVAQGNGYYSMPVTLQANATYTYDSSLRLAIYDTTGKFVAIVNSGSYTPTEDCIASVIVEDANADLSAISINVNGLVKNVELPKGNMGNLNLVAEWKAETFTITYNLNGGALAAGKTNPTEYTPDDSFELNNPTRTGYTFLGWSGTGLTSVTPSVFITEGSSGNRSYTANWRIINYSLNINLDGGEFTDKVPETFTVNTDTFTLPIPRKSGYTFKGWQCADSSVVQTVTITKGTTQNLAYTAIWEENTAGTHNVYFYGFSGEYIGVVEVQVGKEITPLAPTVVVGYQFNGWNVNLNASDVINSTEDIYVYATYTTGPDKYNITINGVTTEYTQYATVVAEAPAESDGKVFSHWVDENGKVASYYRSFSFKAHANTTLTAIYGSADTIKVATRITKAEYNSQYKWITFYADRSIATEYTVLQHGIMFTDIESVATSDSAFQIGNENVYVGTATGRNRSGVYTLSIGGLTEYGAKLYGRSYAIVVDANGVKHTVYSEIPGTYLDGINVYNNVLSQPTK